MVPKQVCLFSLILLVFSLPIASKSMEVAAQTSIWTEPVNLSHTPHGSWFPDLAVDNLGNVHVVWCETTTVPGGQREIEQVFYTMWNGQTWTEPNDIVPSSPDIIRNAIAADQAGRLHMLFGGSVPSIGQLSIFYKNAPIGEAWSAARWSAPHRIGGGRNYEADIAIGLENTIHVVYDQGVSSELEFEGTTFTVMSSDIFYRRSTDGGATWSRPVNLFASLSTGSAREQMEIDSRGTIHVTWDEGLGPLTGRGTPDHSVYLSSSDDGLSWRSPITVTYPTTGTLQLTPGADGRGGVMLVWRSVAREQNGIYYQWSNDDGDSWSPPARIPGVFARRWHGPFDMYDMAADSDGHIHLVAVARLSTEVSAPLNVYHLEWDGVAWSRAEVIYAGEGFPEFPKIAISRGNQLHATWFVRDDEIEHTRREVWYSSSQSAAPPQTPVPLPILAPSPTAVPATSLALIPTPSPFPTPSSDAGGLPDGLYTESDEVIRLMIALSPVVFLVVLVMAVRRGRIKRPFR